MKTNQTLHNMKTRQNKTQGDTGTGAGWMKKGAAIERESERLAAENERKAEQRKRTGGIDPNKSRFWIKKGDETEVVLLDDAVDTVAFFEHNIKKDGKWGNFESCPGEWSNCPLCATGDNKAFVWFLTILDCTGYTKDDGTEVPYFRKLLPIKSSQANTYKRILKAAQKEHGTIRGVVLTLERDTGDKSPAIGEPVIRDTGKMYDFMDEDELVEEFGHAAIKAKNGDVIIKKNDLLQPFDYEAIFQKPDAKDIAKRWGLGGQAGSDDDYVRETEEEPRSRKSKVKDVEPEADEEEEEEHPFLRIAAVADKKGASRNLTLDSAAEEAGLEADDFDSWVELAEELLISLEKPKAAKNVAKKSAKRVVDEGDEEEEEEPRKLKRGKSRRSDDERPPF